MQTRTGPLEIARLAGLPIVPLAARSTCEMRVPTWDRMRIPLPRAHIALKFGVPRSPAASAPDAATLEAQRRALATALHDLDAEVSALVGRGDRYPAKRHLDWLDAPLENKSQ